MVERQGDMVEEAKLRDVVRTLSPLLVGNILEWYEFSVYGYQSAHMAANFFNGSSIGTWLGYGASFVARPIGGVLCGFAADRIGRKPVALASLLAMVLATGCQGLLPTNCGNSGRNDVGLWLLFALRLLQGISVGGEEASVGTYLAEASPLKRKALGTSLFFCTAFVAFMLSSGIVTLLSESLGSEAMACWGWRVPFLIVFPFGLVALMVRTWTPETAAFRSASKTPSRLRDHICGIAVGCVAAAGFSAVFYTGNIWCVGHLKASGMDKSAASALALANNAVLVLLTPFFGWLADVIGVGCMMLGGSVATAVLGLPVFWLLTALQVKDSWFLAFLCLGFGYGIPIAVLSAGSLLFCAELFPTDLRGRGLALTHNLAMSIVGGSAPLVSQALVSDARLGPGALISCMGLLSAITIALALRLRCKGRLEMTHMRPAPYCHMCMAKQEAQFIEDGDGSASVSSDTSESV